MPLVETRRGTRMIVEVPMMALALDPELETAYKEYLRANQLKIRAESKLYSLRRSKLEAAQRTDAQARAEHLKSGSKEPFVSTAIAKVEEAAKEAEQELAAREILLEEAEQAWSEMVLERKATYIEAIDKRLTELAVEYEEAIATLEAARLAAHDCRMVRYWIREFPMERAKPGLIQPIREIPGTGELEFQMVTNALRADAAKLMVPPEVVTNG